MPSLEEFKNLKSTNIRNDLLKALICGGSYNEHRFDGFINNGHGRESEERHILSYLIKKALNIHRLPGYNDLVIIPQFFERFTTLEIKEATNEIKRIYNFTQEQLRIINNETTVIKLRRGISDIEANVIYSYLNAHKELDIQNVPYFFQTIQCFNCIPSPFQRDISLNIDCPLDWIWACGYTLPEIAPANHIDDEFLVTSLDDKGILNVPISRIKINSEDNLNLIDTKIDLSIKENNIILSHLASNMLETVSWNNSTKIVYKFGKREEQIYRFLSRIFRIYDEKRRAKLIVTNK
ncbi:hypothetical protein [Halobacteriovorax sp. DPLXC-1]|uniref:hypothetical protein n=1 Tax=Halobacteriovorax sp. DPLXC-1 TaxID=3110771 RepID=UPI002FF097A2